MMYGETDEIRAQAAWKRAVWIACVMGGAGLLITILGLVIRLKWLSTAALALGGCAAYGWTMLKVMPWSAYLKFLRDMKEGLKRETEGAFVSMDEETRLVDGICVHDLLLNADCDTDLLFYWDDEKPRPALEPGRHLRLTSFGKFVTALEML